MDEYQTALYIFRKLVYLLYLEIGALQPRNHPQVAEKAKLNTAYFQREKERQAVELYRQIEHETDLAKILEPYEERTGLRLEDVHRAFAEGDWTNKYGAYNFGGPKWERVADVTLQLQRAIEQHDAQKIAELILTVKKLKTNQGYIVNQFDRTDRRR